MSKRIFADLTESEEFLYAYSDVVMQILHYSFSQVESYEELTPKEKEILTPDVFKIIKELIHTEP